MTVMDDFVAETLRLQGILGLLTQAQWQAESGADGWSVADVVLHLAQSDEAVAASADGADHRQDVAAAGTVDGWAARMVEAERTTPDLVFARWREARDTAVEALRTADPGLPLPWVGGPVKPATLTTTRLAEYWAHGLDITDPLGIDFPDTDRLRHIAWLAHRTLPYALSRGGRDAGRGALLADRAGRGHHVDVRPGRRRLGDHRVGRRLLPGGRPAPRPGRLRLAGHRPARRGRPARRQDLRVTPDRR